MFTHVETTQKQLTRELAEDFATMPAFRGERALNTKRINWLFARLRQGQFHPPRWAVAQLNGATYRVNGQHSSYMLANLANGLFPQGTTVLIDEYACESEQDLADLFMQFDAPRSQRTQAESCAAHARTHDELGELTPTACQNIVTAIAWYLRHVLGVQTDREASARLVHEHKPFFVQLGHLFSQRFFARAPVGAAIFATWNVHPETAQQFWELVRDEDHLLNDHPTRTLARFLREELSKDANKRDAFGLYARCVHAWNAYRDGRMASVLRHHRGAGLPKVK